MDHKLKFIIKTKMRNCIYSIPFEAAAVYCHVWTHSTQAGTSIEHGITFLTQMHLVPDTGFLNWGT